MIVTAVPVKDLVNAKQRLVRALGPGERRSLARAMLADVLRALAAAGLGPVWVVTRDPEASALARGLGADALAEEANRGHTAAVAAARAQAVRRGARTFVTVPGDAPCVTPAELRVLAAAAAESPAVFVPSRSGLGTNGAALSPPSVMDLVFGEPSFDNHLAAARARGLRPHVLRLRGLGLDVDTPDDLRGLLAEGPATETGRLVAGWPIAARLASRAAGESRHRWRPATR